jgi:tryptophanyl-tRNA synthetase
LELTRNIAQRFNALYGNTFVVPEAYIPKETAKIMSLSEPTKKMSKSDPNKNAFISILDKPDTIIKKFKRAITDSDAEVVYKEGKDGINNLLSIYCAVTNKTIEEAENEFAGKGYGDFKVAVGEAVVEELHPIQEKFDYLIKNKDYLEKCYKDGAEKAEKYAQRTLDKVYKKIGFIAK